jgi:hypothetical protein
LTYTAEYRLNDPSSSKEDNDTFLALVQKQSSKSKFKVKKNDLTARMWPILLLTVFEDGYESAFEFNLTISASDISVSIDGKRYKTESVDFTLTAKVEDPDNTNEVVEYDWGCWLDNSICLKKDGT